MAKRGPKLQRLDAELVARKIARSREHAQEMIKAGRVTVNGMLAKKPAAIAGMLAAGFFEYNFGDSEFLMMFLVLVTLPFAAARW